VIDKISKCAFYKCVYNCNVNIVLQESNVILNVHMTLCVDTCSLIVFEVRIVCQYSVYTC